jgi:hypothetical protein
VFHRRFLQHKKYSENVRAPTNERRFGLCEEIIIAIGTACSVSQPAAYQRDYARQTSQLRSNTFDTSETNKYYVSNFFILVKSELRWRSRRLLTRKLQMSQTCRRATFYKDRLLEPSDLTCVFLRGESPCLRRCCSWTTFIDLPFGGLSDDNRCFIQR